MKDRRLLMSKEDKKDETLVLVSRLMEKNNRQRGIDTSSVERCHSHLCVS